MKRFGTDGIRGQWGSAALNPDIARALATVLMTEFEGPIPIVRDTRESGSAILKALEEGMGNRGVDYGILPTPALSAILAATGARVGIAITASHNPWQDNGLKVLGRGGFKLSPEEESVIDGALDGAIGCAQGQGSLCEGEGGAEMYLQAQCNAVGPTETLQGAKIAIDAANGAGFESAERLLDACGMQSVVMGNHPNGQNINEGVGALHPEGLQELVLRENCAAGIALDGDADRCTLIDAAGNLVHGDALLLLLAKGPGVVGTVMCNSALEDALSTRGMAFHRSAVGDRNVQLAMSQRGWQVGGEPSGHVLMTDALPTGDGLITGLRALAGGFDLASRLSDFTPFPSVQAAVRVASKPPLETLAPVQQLIEQARATLKGRVLLRYSGTEPKLRILVEAQTEVEAQEWCERFEEAVKAQFP